MANNNSTQEATLVIYTDWKKWTLGYGVGSSLQHYTEIDMDVAGWAYNRLMEAGIDVVDTENCSFETPERTAVFTMQVNS